MSDGSENGFKPSKVVSKSVETGHDEEGRLTTIKTIYDNGQTLLRTHRFPDEIRHYYRHGSIGEKIPLYNGEFSAIGEGEVGHTYAGGVWFSWTPTPRVIAAGERTMGDISEAFLEYDGPMWVPMAEIAIPESDTRVPHQPTTLPGEWSGEYGTAYMETRVGRCDVGSPVAIDRLTFLIPNGWQASDGFSVCSPANRARFRRGRMQTEAAGWEVSIDPLEDMQKSDWDHLKETGGTRATHVGEIRKADGSRFHASDADNLLETIRITLSFAMGRAVNCLLPVGWVADAPKWARWAGGSVDSHKNVHTWLDQTIACRQIGHLLANTIETLSNDDDKRRIIRYAHSYYVTANYDVDAELATAIPLSGLQLLAFNRFVEERGVYTKTQWKNSKVSPKNIEEEIRLLLDDCNISTKIPDHFKHLQVVAEKLSDPQSDEEQDALSCIINMRHTIIHPTRKMPFNWTFYQWAEAAMMSRYFLQMAILNSLNYTYDLSSMVSPNRIIGATEKPSWTGSNSVTSQEN